MDQWQYLKHVEDAYKAQCKVSGVTGLYLISFPETIAGVELSGEIRDLSLALEEKIRELYRVEKEARQE